MAKKRYACLWWSFSDLKRVTTFWLPPSFLGFERLAKYVGKFPSIQSWAPGRKFLICVLHWVAAFAIQFYLNFFSNASVWAVIKAVPQVMVSSLNGSSANNCSKCSLKHLKGNDVQISFVEFQQRYGSYMMLGLWTLHVVSHLGRYTKINSQKQVTPDCAVIQVGRYTIIKSQKEFQLIVNTLCKLLILLNCSNFWSGVGRLD